MALRVAFLAALVYCAHAPRDARCAEPSVGERAGSHTLAETPAGEAPAADTDAAEISATQAADEDYYELYKVFADTLDHVERNYVKPISRRELMEAAIRGVLDKLDPYSSYISPEELGQFKTSVESQFGGIGITISMEGGQLRILSPLVGSPAYRAGLQPGDRITRIEGESTEGITIDQAVSKLKGEAGTEVTITVSGRGAPSDRTLTLTREVVHVETVLGDHRGDDDLWEFMLDSTKKIGYIRLTGFSRDTARDLKKALDGLVSRGMRGLILDLRFNPGGLLTSAVEIADLFVTEGRIVSTEGRNSPERVWSARRRGTYEDFPMVVLVNHYSASASEIVSACLQDHERAVIVGERTWGKGSVQNVIDLEDGRSALKLTTAGYKRPNGHNIHRFPDAKESDEWGVMPNDGFEIKLTDGETTQLVLDRRRRDLLVENHYHPEAEVDANTPPIVAPADETPRENLPRRGKQGRGAPSEPRAADEEFVDRQLRKAVDFLSDELARAD